MRTPGQARDFRHATFNEVDAVFTSFVPPTQFERGRYDRPHAEPFSKPEEHPTLQFAPDYRVKTTFNDGQQPYVALVAAGLGTLLEGDKEHPSFANHVSRRFMSQTGEADKEPSFMSAFLGANLDLLSQFSASRTNLTPALKAYYLTGGIDGIVGGCMMPARVMLKGALNEPILIDIAIGMNQDRKLYVARHPFERASPRNNSFYVESSSPEYEVWCAGRKIAKSMLEQTAKAALSLAKTEGVREVYDANVDEELERFNGENVLREHVARIYEEAKATSNRSADLLS